MPGRDASADLPAFPTFTADLPIRHGLKLGHMKMMVALEDSGQISTAASLLNISQPAASRMLAEMEAILKVPLCERLPRGVVPTPYGVAFARRARAILLELREADREIGDLKSGKGGSVFLGAVTAPAIALVVPAIRQIRETYPKIQIDMQVETSNVLAKELLASRHDFIIARIPDDLSPRLFDAQVIGIEKACLLVRRGHPLMRRDSVRFEDLTSFDWVFQPAGSLLRRTVEAGFLARGVPLPERILNTSSLLLTLAMVAQSDAIAPIALEVAKFINDDMGLQGAVDILPSGFEFDVQPYSLITVRGRVLSPAATMLKDIVLANAA